VSISKQVSPPKAAMYWSCLPTGSLSSSISIRDASSARALGVTCSRFIA
jgi:hypothetical protein